MHPSPYKRHQTRRHHYLSIFHFLRLCKHGQSRPPLGKLGQLVEVQKEYNSAVCQQSIRHLVAKMIPPFCWLLLWDRLLQVPATRFLAIQLMWQLQAPIGLIPLRIFRVLSCQHLCLQATFVQLVKFVIPCLCQRMEELDQNIQPIEWCQQNMWQVCKAWWMLWRENHLRVTGREI